MSRFTTIGMGVAAAAALTVSATPALAAPSAPAGRSVSHGKPARSCPEETYYTVKWKKAVSYWVPRTTFVDGKGGTVTGRIDRSWTKSATLEKGAEASIGAVWATVKGHVSKSATKSNTVTVGHWYTHDISRNKYGHIRYRVIGYRVLFYKMAVRRSCKTVLLDAFYGNIPTEQEGWKYWETSRL
ncbi:hypothetical protein [Actinomadura macrotermitis]|uniref:Uncharacterized protein n=1 Tax=Actinomadura macrotermitis TaxID=2585200 RepID=A0A7K0BYN2_9ACTN|nr:hypothetical protein [Actinomadura macrotermitis]MQY05754.1 hypothetical protein [Actinomadura macrotermitis]